MEQVSRLPSDFNAAQNGFAVPSEVQSEGGVMASQLLLIDLNMWITGLTAPFQGLFRVTSTAVRLDHQVGILMGDEQFRRGRYGYGGYGYTP